MVELIEQDHLESVLGLFDQEVADNLWDTIIEDIHNNFKVSI